MQTQNTYDPTTGRISNVQAQPTGGTVGSLVNLSMGWDPLNNLLSRSDANGNATSATGGLWSNLTYTSFNLRTRAPAGDCSPLPGSGTSIAMDPSCSGRHIQRHR